LQTSTPPLAHWRDEGVHVTLEVHWLAAHPKGQLDVCSHAPDVQVSTLPAVLQRVAPAWHPVTASLETSATAVSCALAESVACESRVDPVSLAALSVVVTESEVVVASLLVATSDVGTESVTLESVATESPTGVPSVVATPSWLAVASARLLLSEVAVASDFEASPVEVPSAGDCESAWLSEIALSGVESAGEFEPPPPPQADDKAMSAIHKYWRR
jgi:hypothetical protein